jgi:hypothetical protein
MTKAYRTKVTDFIEGLSSYYTKENDLSNLTCLICNSSENFKSKFLQFFFPDINVKNVDSIQREVTDCNGYGCRVDIYVTLQDDDSPYIIEVKIYDAQHHFGTYEAAYNIDKIRFGYITNYVCAEGLERGYNVKTWEELYKYLTSFDDNDELTLGYLAYLKNTCNITIYDKPMNILGLKTIPCFIDTAKKLISTQRDWVETSQRRVYIDRNGLNVSFTFKFIGQKERRDGFGLLGIWFNNPSITFGVDDREWLSNRIMERSQEFDGQTFDCPYYDYKWDDNDIWFDMDKKYFDKFNTAGNYEQQYKILNNFFEEVLKSISKCFNFKH